MARVSFNIVLACSDCRSSLSRTHRPTYQTVSVDTSTLCRSAHVPDIKAAECFLFAERGHRSPQSREGSLGCRVSYSCIQHCQHSPDYDQGVFPSAAHGWTPCSRSFQDAKTNERDYVELGLSCADVCRALDRGMSGKKPEDLAQSVREAINQLTTLVDQ